MVCEGPKAPVEMPGWQRRGSKCVDRRHFRGDSSELLRHLGHCTCGRRGDRPAGSPSYSSCRHSTGPHTGYTVIYLLLLF